MTIANISMLLLFSVICAVGSWRFHIYAKQEFDDINKFEDATFAKVYARIIWGFIYFLLSISCLFGAAYIAWVAYG